MIKIALDFNLMKKYVIIVSFYDYIISAFIFYRKRVVEETYRNYGSIRLIDA